MWICVGLQEDIENTRPWRRVWNPENLSVFSFGFKTPYLAFPSNNVSVQENTCLQQDFCWRNETLQLSRNSLLPADWGWYPKMEQKKLRFWHPLYRCFIEKRDPFHDMLCQTHWDPWIFYTNGIDETNLGLWFLNKKRDMSPGHSGLRMRQKWDTVIL